MEEVQKIYYTVGEIAEMLGVPTHIIRSLSAAFNIQPKRTKSGVRRYTREELLELQVVVSLNKLPRTTLIRRILLLEYPRTFKKAA